MSGEHIAPDDGDPKAHRRAAVLHEVRHLIDAVAHRFCPAIGAG
jgi:hypothetical protein